MIRVLAFLIIILVGLCLSPFMVGNTGYVYVAIADKQIETSLVFATFLLVLAFGLLQLVEWLLIRLLTLMINSRLLPERWRRNAARKNTLLGALALAEENWQQAEVSMAKGAQKGELPALNLLAAARAAQHQQNYEQRDLYLTEAETYPQAQQAVRTSRVRYLMQQQTWDEATRELDKLHPGPRSSVPVLKLALELYRHEKSWGELLKLIPVLKKKQISTPGELAALEHTVHTHRLEDASEAGLPQLELTWGDVPRTQQDSDLLALYCRGLAKFNQDEKAIKLLLKSLKKHLHPELIVTLAEIAPTDNDSAIKFLSGIAVAEANNAAYQEAMAKLNQRRREFKQAKLHWQRVCELAPSRQSWLALGELQQQLGDNLTALNSFHHAAKM